MGESYNKFQRRNNVKTKVTSIWLEETDEPEMVLEYCGTCRAPMFQHGGHLVTKIPGNSPSKLPLYLQCRNKNCGRKYKIHVMIKGSQ